MTNIERLRNVIYGIDTSTNIDEVIEDGVDSRTTYKVIRKLKAVERKIITDDFPNSQLARVVVYINDTLDYESGNLKEAKPLSSDIDIDKLVNAIELQFSMILSRSIITGEKGSVEFANKMANAILLVNLANLDLRRVVEDCIKTTQGLIEDLPGMSRVIADMNVRKFIEHKELFINGLIKTNNERIKRDEENSDND